MEINYQANGREQIIHVKDFYKDVASMLSKEPADTGCVTITCEGKGIVKYALRRRSGTLFITEEVNTLPDSIVENNCPSRYLTCVDEGKNAYKFYKLEVSGNEVKASYGRMGVRKGELFGERTYMYPLSMFWIKYYEKLAKGYIDNSDVYLSPEAEQKPASPSAHTAVHTTDASQKLFSELQKYAKKAVRDAQVNVPVTRAILEKSESLLNKMRKADTTEVFNDILLQLIAILQRPVRTGNGSGVRELMAKGTSDFSRILQREQDLLMAMDGSIKGNTSGHCDDFSIYGIEVYNATPKQKAQVLSRLSDELKTKVRCIYRVIPKAQQEQFNHYLEQKDIKTVKQLWHGSRNQNWMSIIRNGLLLNPDAPITGKMFSEGIYFAPSSMKSWNYTSYHGTSWANGHDDCAFMGLYATAYGKPWDVHIWKSCTDYKKETLKNGADCLHAHAGSSLRNDEIVFYSESATVLNYIVEFR